MEENVRIVVTGDNRDALKKLNKVEDAVNRLNSATKRVEVKVSGIQEAERQAARLYEALERLESAALSKLPQSLQTVIAYLKAANAGLGEFSKRAITAAAAVGDIGRVPFAPIIKAQSQAIRQFKQMKRGLVSLRVEFVRVFDRGSTQPLLDGLNLVRVSVLETRNLLEGRGDFTRPILDGLDLVKVRILEIKGLLGGIGGAGGGGRIPPAVPPNAPRLPQGRDPQGPQGRRFTFDPNTLRGLRQGIGYFRELLETAEIGSQRFRVLEDTIADLNKKLEDAQLQFQKATTRATPGSIAALREEIAAKEAAFNQTRRGTREFNELADELRRLNTELSKTERFIEGRTKGRAGRVGTALQSAALGGGFPLLFGGPSFSALGGAAGGFAGGLVGQGTGFALGIVGSAAGTFADQLKEAADTIAEALDGTSASLEAVKEAGINVSDATINYVKELEEAGRAIDAYNAVQQELNSIYGTEGVRVLQELKEANNFANTEAGKLSAVLQTELAPVFILLAQLSGSVARGLRDFIPDLLNLIADYTIGVPGATAFNEVVGQTPRSNPALVAAGVRQREAELAADAQLQSITATTEGLRRQAQINELNNDLTNKRVVALKRAGIESKANNKIEELSQEITADIFNTNLKRVNLAKIQQVEQQRIVDLAKLEADERKAIEAATARQTRELEKQAALQRKIRDAQISRQLAEDIFANQPAINATPFSRTTPEQDRESALQLQQIKYAAEIDKINNSITNEQLKQEALDTASARNQLARLNIERQYASTVKQNTEQFLTLTGDLKTQLGLQTATTRQQAEQLRLQQEMTALSRSGTYTEKQLQDIKKLKQALIEAQGPLNQFLTDTERAINNLMDTEVQIVTAAQSIEREFSAAFQSVITGTTSVQQALSTMLANIGRDFIAMATQIIAKQLVMIALNRTLGIFGLFGGAGGGGFGVPVLTSGLDFSGAFRNGGRPEPRKVAIVGENGPELFIPDGYGRIIPNGRYKIDTGGVGGAPNTITVNVDARSTDVQGDDDKSRQLGTTISRVIQAELVRQQRPGGLLYGNR